MKIEIKHARGFIEVRQVAGESVRRWERVHPGSVDDTTGWLYRDLLALGEGIHEVEYKQPGQAELEKRKQAER